MKKFSWTKGIQLLVLTALMLSCFFLLLSNTETRQRIFSDPPVRTLCILLWVVLLLSYAALILDFQFLSKLKRENFQLNRLAYLDDLSGIPNRFSCDMLLARYRTSALPQDLGCVMMDISSLRQINQDFGRSLGNRQIQSFSRILDRIGRDYGFVGRNGGNKFIAMLENCREEMVTEFIAKLHTEVRAHNAADSSHAIHFRWGCALNGQEHCTDLSDLIALADQNIHQDIPVV